MVFSGKQGRHWVFDQMCTTLLICISNHAFLKLFIYSLAQYMQRIIGPRSFCTNLASRAQTVQKRLGSDISLYRPHVKLIRN